MGMRFRTAVVAAFLLTACEGPEGPAGASGGQGEQGERGERGERGEQGDRGERGEQGDRGERGEDGTQQPVPLPDAPRIVGLAPASGSARSLVTVSGTDFGEAPEVWFDGTRAELVSATDDQLVVRPTGAVVREERVVQVTVIAGALSSNAVSWRALPSGAIEPTGLPLLGQPGPVAATSDGSLVYTADLGTGHLFRIDVGARRTTPLQVTLPGVRALAMHPSDARLYVAWETGLAELPYAVSALDLASLRLTAVDVFHDPVQHIAFVGDLLLVGIEGGQIRRYPGGIRGDLSQWTLTGAPQAAIVGFAGIGTSIFVALADGTVHRSVDGTAPPQQLALAGLVGLRGLAADGGVLLGIGSDEYLIDVHARTVTPRGRYTLQNSGWRASWDPRGGWFLSERQQGVHRLAPDGTSAFLSTAAFGVDLERGSDGIYFTTLLCNFWGGLQPGLARIDEGGVDIVLPGVCALRPKRLADGSFLLFDLLEGGRLIRWEPNDPVAYVLAERTGTGAGLVVGDGHAYLLKSDGSIDRYALASGALEREWARSIGSPSSGVVRGSQLVVRTGDSFEAVDLATGGTARLLVRYRDLLDNLGGLVVDGEGRLLFPSTFGVEQLLDDRTEVLFQREPQRYHEGSFFAVLPDESGDLLMLGRGAMFRGVY